MNINSNKLIVVTGASSGLGYAIAAQLIEDGYRVIGLSRRGESPPGSRGIECDVSNYQSVEAALCDVAKDKELYGLINCAGIASMNLVLSTPPETISRIINVNLIGTINVCHFLSKRFARNKKGRIVNVSTIAVPLSLKGEAIYVASKSGVEGFSRTFAREMADFGVNVNIIAPGPIDTNLIASVPSGAIDKIINNQIIPQKFEKDAAIKLCQYLLSEQSYMLSGQILNIGGA